MVDFIAPFRAFIKPWEEVKNLKGSLVDGLIYTEIGAAVLAVIAILVGSVATSLLQVGGLVRGGSILLMAVGLLIGAPIGVLVGSLIYYVIAKLLGGKGTFERQTFLFGVVSFPTMIFSWIPIVNLLVPLWSLVVTFFVLKEAHGLSDLKTLLVEFLPAVIAIVLGILLLGVLVSL